MFRKLLLDVGRSPVQPDDQAAMEQLLLPPQLPRIHLAPYALDVLLELRDHLALAVRRFGRLLPHFLVVDRLGGTLDGGRDDPRVVHVTGLDCTHYVLDGLVIRFFHR